MLQDRVCLQAIGLRKAQSPCEWVRMVNQEYDSTMMPYVVAVVDVQ